MLGFKAIFLTKNGYKSGTYVPVVRTRMLNMSSNVVSYPGDIIIQGTLFTCSPDMNAQYVLGHNGLRTIFRERLLRVFPLIWDTLYIGVFNYIFALFKQYMIC